MEAFFNQIFREVIKIPVYDIQNSKDIVLRKQTLYSKTAQQLILIDQKKTNDQKQISTYSFISLSIDTQRKEKHFEICFITEDHKLLQMNIQSLIIHPKTHNQICIFNQTRIAFIKDIINFTEKNNQIIIRHIFTDTPIIKMKFSYFDNVFGVLLSNNTFRIYSIDSSQYLVEITNFAINSPIVDFEFCPFNQSNPYWEAFMVYFIGEKGQLSITGPFFPKEFKLNRIDFIAMKHRLLYLNELSGQLYSALEKSIVPNPKIDSNDINSYFSINYQLDNWNKHLTARAIMIQNNLSYDYNKEICSRSYKQMELITSEPYVFLLRITKDNRIEVIVLFEIIVPIRMWYNLVNDENSFNTEIKGNFLIEVIHLLPNNQSLTDNSTPVNIIIVDKENAIIEENSNVYYIQFAYISSMRLSFLGGDQQTPYNSIANLIVNSSQNKPIMKKEEQGEIEIKVSKNYFVFEVINNIIVLCKLIDKKLACKTLPVAFNQFQSKMSKPPIFSPFEPQLSNISFVDSFHKKSIKLIKDELDLVNHFEHKNVFFDPKSKITKKALRTATFEGVINEQMNSFAKHYESIFNTQYDMLQFHFKAINQEIDLIEKSEIKESYTQCLKQFKDISKQQNEIKRETEEINKLLFGIKEKVYNINLNSKPVIKSLAIINTFQNERENELKAMTSLLTLYDKQIKDISLQNELCINITFNDDIITSNAKEQVNSFVQHIRSIKELVNQCVNELQNK